MALAVRVVRVDYARPAHATALLLLLNAYACDPMGGGEGLSEFAFANLVPALAARAQAFSVLAFASEDDSEPIGLVNCFEGFSTFACKPLVNVHDVVVLPDHRGLRIAEKMLGLVEQIARERGACKLTLEVLSDNAAAIRLYERAGFSYYRLDPSRGAAGFMQKVLRSS